MLCYCSEINLSLYNDCFMIDGQTNHSRNIILMIISPTDFSPLLLVLISITLVLYNSHVDSIVPSNKTIKKTFPLCPVSGGELTIVEAAVTMTSCLQ